MNHNPRRQFHASSARFRNVFVFCALIFALAARVGSVGAQETAYPLEPVTVIGTKSEKKVFDYPGMASVIDASDPAVSGASKVKDMLRDVPGLEFSGSARRNGQGIVMRGYDTDGLVILLDGVRQRFEAAHDGKFFIDPNILQRVEVIRGPSSALYGSGGLGGVIAFETKSVSDLLEPGEKSGGVTTLGGETVNDEHLFSQSVFTRGDTTDFLGSVAFRKSDDVELGSGDKLSSKDDIVSGFLKTTWSPSPFSTFKLNLQRYQNDSEEPNNPQDDMGSGALAEIYDKETKSDLILLGFDYDQPERNINLKTKLYRNAISVDERNAAGRSLAREMDADGFDIENQSKFHVGRTRYTVTAGAQHYTERQDGRDTTSANGESGGIPDADSDYWGVFAQTEIELDSDLGKWFIIPGVRIDNYESENETGLSLDERKTSPKLGVSFQSNKGLLLFGNYSRAFRAPTMTEIFTTGVHFSLPPRGASTGGNNVFVPNPALKPETNETLEFGFGMRFVDVARDGDRLQFKVARFDVDSGDFIDSKVDFPRPPAPCCGTTTTVNVPDAELDGWELDGSYENEAVRVNLSYSTISGENSDTGKYLTNISPDTLRANVAWELPAWNSTIGMRATFAAEHDEVEDVADERDSFNVYDLYYQWRSTGDKKFSVNFGVDNVFNKEYSRVFANSLEPGRSYKLQVSRQW